ncbi:MAG: saccharopine dehydrogenase NADP-binding domain-containing protein [Solirubrobacterales bacterium]|nr:saccharopine dehydrogenase NADP-binding domain-containing protein [Solirubrobacterales bacterium]
MSESKQVVVYGASGYTGRLVAEYLREHGLSFLAAGRNAERVQEIMDHVPGIETADYAVAGVEHDVEALTELFSGARVVCNMVGPFAKYGHEAVQASLAAGCHYTDTNGEQSWMIECEEQYGAAFAEAGLLLSPGIAQMYTTGEIAANVCLETPGLDTLDMLVLWKGFPTTASTQTIFTTLASDHFYLDNKQYVPWTPGASFSVDVPGQHAPAIALSWGGTAHPVWFRRDPRVASCKALGGVADQTLMAGVVQMTEAIAAMPPEEQGPALEAQAAQTQGGMPPRENQRVNTSLDSVYATGPAGSVHCVLRGACNYKQTGLLQAFAAYHLVHGAPRRVGFASGCQAFGHRELLGVLQAFGLSGQARVSGDVSPQPLIPAPGAIGSVSPVRTAVMA